MIRRLIHAAGLLALFFLPVPAIAQQGASGLPLPRFVSLRAAEVNLRTGPGVRYPIEWVFERRGLPLQIIAEFETWRQVRDLDGTTGWVHRSMLSGKRTVTINGDIDRLHDKPKEDAAIAAYVEAGIIAALDRCDDAWCHVTVEKQGASGWIARTGLWGVLPDEEVR